ncbi:glycoside hydrolase family 3 protein [Paenibacillus chibensis]|uniref:glycoside hydrolase family 3 protein n=1 Tax=Paenibacillus chibensis TaxID=59846 RepID=UPI000FDB33D9|nr:glycoside hydrolase family 3 protein [Paenibacillus chibensis]MEC0371948.1 glycoside hydrolase family 3 N-terminal domain-containing protein [Paenibacillus chibensis]
MNISNLTLVQKIGQMFICGFHSLVPDDQIRTLIQQYHLGGVIYFRRNIDELELVAGLSKSLQDLAAANGSLPLWIAIDQEGGMVARIDHKKMSRIPGNMALGATDNPKYSYEVSVISAQEMTQLGINMNFAPCVDVNNNPLNPVIGVRSFGEQADKVAEHGAAVIRSFQENGISAAAKHFPGHGDTSVDSHMGLATVEHDVERLQQVELKPFIRAIQERVDVIMTAHVIFPAIEPEPIPATLSRSVLTGLLREDLSYQGIIVTDCLEMHAIAKFFGVGEGAVQAIEAGADIVLVSHTLSDQIEAIEAVKQAVLSGRIHEKTIDTAVERILALKQQRIADVPESEAAPVFLERHEKPEVDRLLQEVARKSITLVKDQGQLPLDTQSSVLVVWPEVRSETQVDEPWTEVVTLGDALAAYIGQVKEIRISAEPDEQEIELVLREAASCSQVVVATYTAGSALPEGQRELVEGLQQQKLGKLIVASTRNPYDLNDIPGVPAYLCCYENTPYFMEALAAILAGHSKAEGQLPVRLDDPNAVGVN